MHAAMKLGRIRSTSRQLALAPRLHDFMTAPLPPPPPEFHGTDGAAIGMFGNDTYGDCTIAGLANYRAIRAAMTKQPTPPSTTDSVVVQYMRLTGGQDTGLNEIDVLVQARQNGMELGGPTWMDAVWASVRYDQATCRSLIAIFGALYLGVELPVAAQTQTVWTPTTGRNGAPGGWGGHCLLWSGWQPGGGNEELVTWGGVQQADQSWLPKYGDEFHLIVDADSAAIAGVDFEKLVAYSNEVNDG
jgi:hypothetical protein